MTTAFNPFTATPADVKAQLDQAYRLLGQVRRGDLLAIRPPVALNLGTAAAMLAETCAEALERSPERQPDR